jgi:hypothetical protein
MSHIRATRFFQEPLRWNISHGSTTEITASTGPYLLYRRHTESMDRRSFFARLFGAAAAVAVVPIGAEAFTVTATGAIAGTLWVQALTYDDGVVTDVLGYGGNTLIACFNPRSFAARGLHLVVISSDN